MKVCPNCQSKYPDDANFCPAGGLCHAPKVRAVGADRGRAAGPRSRPRPRSAGRRSGEVWQAQRHADRRDRRVQAGLARGAADAGGGGARAARAEAAAALAEPAHRARARLRQGRRTAGSSSPPSCVGGSRSTSVVGGSGPLSLDRAKKIVAQIGEALLEGQKVGVVHHDLSPEERARRAATTR